MAEDAQPGPSRRGLLVGGGVGVGLVVAWAVWPRRYRPNLTAAPGETVFGAWLKIGADGLVTVAVPQCEHGQGVYTTLPQIIADELGADWRTVAVEPAPLNPLYANPLAAEELFYGVFGMVPATMRVAHVTRTGLELTAGSTSVRRFEQDLREAGAAARAMLCKAAARQWGVDWQACDTAQGFVTYGKNRLRFGPLAEAAARESAPDDVPLRFGDAGRLTGRSLPRLDVPSKVDGSANFAGDVRLPDMVFASIRHGPIGDSQLIRVNRAAANRIHGVLSVVETPHWVAAVATDWWAANRALDALAPRFETKGQPIDSASITAALTAALDGPGARIASGGDVADVFKGAEVVTATYRAPFAAHAAIETMTATANWSRDRLELWLPTQAPGAARAAAARAIGVGEEQVAIHPMLAGGSFGANLEHDAAAQAALISSKLKRPVQLTWSRGEDMLRDRYRPAAMARMAARLSPKGQVTGWLAQIAAPATGAELAGRLLADDRAAQALIDRHPGGDRYAVAGAAPIYAVPNWAVDHHPADTGVPTGHWRSGAHSYTAFFTESFIDELAHQAGIDAVPFRIAMLGGNPRLARCLSTAASLGGWSGGGLGSGQGIACHAFRGSHIAVLAEVGSERGRPRVDRLVAAVDCGRVINPDVVKQQVEGGLVFGMAAALSGAINFAHGLADSRGLADLALPTLASTPDITVELIASEADPGGVSELAVPPVAPAIGNALRAATGVRYRDLPLASAA